MFRSWCSVLCLSLFDSFRDLSALQFYTHQGLLSDMLSLFGVVLFYLESGY
jgi:hypothetical protein